MYGTAYLPAYYTVLRTYLLEFFLGNVDTSARVRDQLSRDQLRDWEKRYGSGRSEAALYVAKDFGKIVGCVSVSASPYRELGSDGRPRDPKNPNRVPKRDKQAKVPVLANLVVARSARRRGIAAKLARKCDNMAKKWGYEEVRISRRWCASLLR